MRVPLHADRSSNTALTGALSVADGPGTALAPHARPGEPPAREAGRLGTSRVVLPLHQKRRSGRKYRHSLREGARGVTTLERFRDCGHTAVDGAGVVVRVTDTPDGRRGGFAGLATCGSVWACPVCAAKIAAERAADLTEGLAVLTEKGYRVAMMTFTVRHRKGQALSAVWDAVSKGWARVTSGRAWKEDQARYQVPGWVRAVEVTHGRNGWHVHVHALVPFQGSELDVLALGQSMWRRWEKGVIRAGFSADGDAGGFHVATASKGDDLGPLGHYLAKQGAHLDGLAQEAMLGAFKKAKGENRTPFQVLESFLATGDCDDLDVWHEWERGSKGRRQITWSRGFRDLLGLGKERDDQEVAEEELGTADDGVVLLPGETWRAVRSWAWLLLDVVEEEGPDGLRRWLDRHGYAWSVPPVRSSEKSVSA